jgi:hypothetical protein
MGVERVMSIAMEIADVVTEAGYVLREIEPIFNRAVSAIKNWLSECSSGGLFVSCSPLFSMFFCRIDVNRGGNVFSIQVWFEHDRIRVWPANIVVSSLEELEMFLPPGVFDGAAGDEIAKCLSRELERARKVNDFLKSLHMSIRLLS